MRKNTQKGGAGVGIVIIIIILIIGGIYIWRAGVKEAPPEEVISEELLEEELTEALGIEDITSDIDGIESDLELSNFDEFDIGVDDLGI